MNICIIPARGGSKRIPRKNIKNFCGKPMIAYAITTAKNSELFDKIIVSTDDDEIASIAEQYGAEVLKRPAELADDYATTVAVIRHAIDNIGQNFTNICCIYPCTPLLKSEYLTKSFENWQESNHLFCFPVLAFESSIFRALKIDEQGKTTTIFDNESTRTQDLTTAYHDAGQFYWGSRDAWLNENSIHNHGLAFILPKNSVVDIDNDDDWQFAEMLYRLKG